MLWTAKKHNSWFWIRNVWICGFRHCDPISTSVVNSVSEVIVWALLLQLCPTPVCPCPRQYLRDGGCLGQERHQQNQEQPCASLRLMKRLIRSGFQQKFYTSTWAFYDGHFWPTLTRKNVLNAKHWKFYHTAAACDGLSAVGWCLQIADK